MGLLTRQRDLLVGQKKNWLCSRAVSSRTKEEIIANNGVRQMVEEISLVAGCMQAPFHPPSSAPKPWHSIRFYVITALRHEYCFHIDVCDSSDDSHQNNSFYGLVGNDTHAFEDIIRKT